MRLLANRRSQGLVRSVTSIWVVNAIAAEATPAVIDELRALPAVEVVSPDLTSLRPADGSSTPLEANLTTIGTQLVWDQGDTGSGVVVAELDTGVDVSDPDLAARWRGGSNSWFDPYGEHTALPVDVNGHGTHTMGAIVGGDGGGSWIGVAPGATWIAAKIFDDRGQATASAVHLAFQWVLDPDGDPLTADAPQVVNNSWTSVEGCNLEFEPDIQALRVAGILPVFAAGNFGPTSASSASPANNPALAVGSVDGSDVVAADSSRGPADCGQPSTTYPSVVAPGVSIRSTDLFGLYSNLRRVRRWRRRR